MRLNFLILHNVANFSRTLRNIADYVLCFERYAPQHNYLYHKITEPITDAMRDMPFQVVIIDSSALGIVRYRPRELWYQEKERWSFIKDIDAVKLAFPQDDYHQSETLDELFFDWSIDHVYPAVPRHHSMLYPRTSRRAHIETALTGYVDDRSIDEFAQFNKPFAERTIDVAQRVTFYSPLGGRLAQLKGRLALAMKEAADEAGLTTDISARDEDRIFGDDWLRFLGNSRSITGAPSGVSVWDPKGEIHDKVAEFRSAHPDASFEEVEKACFPGQDGLYDFSTVSPRLFEAALMRCGQVLIEADYLGVLEPHRHYVPVKADFSNLQEAVKELQDEAQATRRIAACFDALMMDRRFRYSTFVARVLQDVDATLSRRHLTVEGFDDFDRRRSEHEAQLGEIARRAAARQERSPAVSRRVPAALAPFVPVRLWKLAKKLMDYGP